MYGAVGICYCILYCVEICLTLLTAMSLSWIAVPFMTLDNDLVFNPWYIKPTANHTVRQSLISTCNKYSLSYCAVNHSYVYSNVS